MTNPILNHVHLHLQSHHSPNTWNSSGLHKKTIITKLCSKMYDSHYSEFRNYINRDDSKLRTYKLFKNSIQIENYLLLIKNSELRREFTKLRISAHQLRVELGRYTVPHKTPYEDRKCRLCMTDLIENEQHFLLECPLYKDARLQLFDNLNSFCDFGKMQTNEQFHFLMSYNNGDSEILNLIISFLLTGVLSLENTIFNCYYSNMSSSSLSMFPVASSL
jgi:hypothetical protein